MKFKFTIAVLCLVFSTAVLNAQITIYENVDILQAEANGEVEINISPDSLSSGIEKIFDGEPFTETGSNDADSVVVTLSFDNTVSIAKSKIFFMIYGGEWSLESADNMEELENKTGSYLSWVSEKVYNPFQWDSVAVDDVELKVVRLTARNLSDKIVHVGEWELLLKKELVSLYILPDPLLLIPGKSLTLKFGAVDKYNNFYDFDFDEQVIWSSSDPGVASFDSENSALTAHSLGTSEISVRTVSNSISGSATLTVAEDFTPELAEQMHVKVAVVYQNPMVGTGLKMHQKFNWYNPYSMIETLVEEYYNASSGVVRYEVVEVHDDQNIFTKLDSAYMTVNQLVDYYNEPNWTTIRSLAEQEGRIKFDYKGMAEYYDFYNKRESGEIDEVWVYAHPFGGMYESQLMGKGAIWWNSPPIKDVPEDFNELLSVMGWNYERTVDLAMHSMGHRMESAVRAAYGRWDVFNDDPNEWEMFTRIDMDLGNRAHIGNIHFPPNGTSDYDYGNTRVVRTYSPNWKRYPYLFDEYKNVSCSEWGCNQYGYMRWWFSRIPKFKGITNGVLNNWWHYFIDYQEAVRIAGETSVVGITESESSLLPSEFELRQNYPNPFNPSTTISFALKNAGEVKLDIYNILGERVETLFNTYLTSGSYSTQWKPEAASGVYFAKLVFTSADNAGHNYSDVIKMIYLK